MIRLDTTLYANSVVLTANSFGVLGSAIPSAGTNGPSVLYQYVITVPDQSSLFRMVVTAFPAVGTLTMNEDGSFIYDAPDGTNDSFTYDVYKDEALLVSSVIETLAVGVFQATQTLTPTAIASLEAWGTPSVLSGATLLTATGITSEEAWGNPVLEVLLKVLVAQSIVSGEKWGNTLLTGGDALVVPVAYRQTYNNIAAFLRTQLISGQDNEVILMWLRNEGYIGNFNEALDGYLRSLGKTGNLQDKFAKWRDE